MQDSNHSKKEFIQKVKNRILENNPDAEIFLYGSRARGDVHEESDWDLLILLNRDNVSRKDESPIRRSIFDLELEYEEFVSVLALSKQEWRKKFAVTPFYNNVMKERIRL